ncbi:hypothetical protein RUM43_012990 [Polyplax serrata]|uniref:Uncharacterized protein n=1 Tax=Polyplax serrata TaxID=468196 RepID=A0AAN8NRC1_POLSC
MNAEECKNERGRRQRPETVAKFNEETEIDRTRWRERKVQLFEESGGESWGKKRKQVKVKVVQTITDEFQGNFPSAAVRIRSSSVLNLVAYEWQIQIIRS